ncbi:hypothetical protein FB570_12319 [Streptomyces sp. T12]|nr:hypothetical protein FB570_12319 [Streptomyces sp. T12]
MREPSPGLPTATARHQGPCGYAGAYESFDVRAAPGQELLVGSAEPGSRSAQALTYLASMAAPHR